MHEYKMSAPFVHSPLFYTSLFLRSLLCFYSLHFTIILLHVYHSINNCNRMHYRCSTEHKVTIYQRNITLNILYDTTTSLQFTQTYSSATFHLTDNIDASKENAPQAFSTQGETGQPPTEFIRESMDILLQL